MKAVEQLKLKNPSDKSEQLLQHMVEGVRDYAIFLLDTKGYITSWNTGATRIKGYHSPEIIGKHFSIFYTKEDIKINKPEQALKMALEEGRYEDTGWRVRKDGSVFWANVIITPIKNSKGAVQGFTKITRDLTLQKKAEEEIEKLNNELDKRIIERTAELELSLINEKKAREEALRNQQKIVILSKASGVLSSSLDFSKTLSDLARIITPAFTDWFVFHEVQADGKIKPIIVYHTNEEYVDLGYKLARKFSSDTNTLKGIYKQINTLKPIFLPQIPDRILKSFISNKENLKILRSLQINSLISVPLIIRKRVNGIMTLIREGEARSFDKEDLEIAGEIARRASLALENGRLYQEAQNLNMELEKRVASRTSDLETINKEMESFSYSVSHDLRAPLRSIDGFSNLILKKYSDQLEETAKDYFMRVIHACRQMGQLIDDLLKLSQITRIEMNMEITDLSEMATGIANELQASQPERKATFIIQPGIIANIDRNLMEIALHNLFDNSWKYSRNQSVTKIEFGIETRDNKMVYYICDNGVGFDMKYLDKLFGAFQRLHGQTEFEGTGIGLATVQRIIRRHGGNIWAEAEVGHGATFYFTLR